MNNEYPKLFLEINDSEYIFVIGNKNEDNKFKIIHESIVKIHGIENSRITDFDLVFNTIKKNIFLIEEKFNFIFKDIVLIINNFRCSFISLSGFQKLNGSQILKENITYILNSIKSNLNETENKKTILHIFNSKYYLDQKKIENLPIGLFGDFYSHELSFCLINNNDYQNLKNIFNKCNVKIKKILLKSFVEGANISNNNRELDSFFQIKINENKSQIFYFENDSLIFQQNFDFGSNLIIKDISKVTSMHKDTVKHIINSVDLTQNLSKNELIEKSFFDNQNYVKIKKKLIFEIAEARIIELLEKIATKNINISGLLKKNSLSFLIINDRSHLNCFEQIYSAFFKKNNLPFHFKYTVKTDDYMSSVNQIVHYGWKKEAIPVTHQKKSILARFFEILFK